MMTLVSGIAAEERNPVACVTFLTSRQSGIYGRMIIETYELYCYASHKNGVVVFVLKGALICFRLGLGSKPSRGIDDSVRVVVD